MYVTSQMAYFVTFHNSVAGSLVIFWLPLDSCTGIGFSVTYTHTVIICALLT